MPEPDAPADQLIDDFLEDTGTVARLSAVDALLSDRRLVRRMRSLDAMLATQVFYVRQRIIGNPGLPSQTRIRALVQLECTIANLPDFTIKR